MEVTQKIWAHIQKNGLNDGDIVKPDEKLKAIMLPDNHYVTYQTSVYIASSMPDPTRDLDEQLSLRTLAEYISKHLFEPIEGGQVAVEAVEEGNSSREQAPTPGPQEIPASVILEKTPLRSVAVDSAEELDLATGVWKPLPRMPHKFEFCYAFLLSGTASSP